MSADARDPLEAEGVLNPATAWGSDGDLYLFPRMVAEGNFSRIGKARVILVDGVPTRVERQGVVLEPDRSWEHGVRHGGVEDPRITRVPSLDVHVMTYVAFGPLGPRPAVAISHDQERWARLGPFQFEYDDALEVDLNLYPNKDVVFFPDVVPDPDGRPSYAVIHRPMWEFGFTHADEVASLPAGTTDSRASIWISYIPEEDVRADISALTRPRGHRFVAGAEFEWESLKVGAGPPPIRVDEGWLLIHHGVSGKIGDDPFVPQTEVFYSAGALILNATDPSQVISRTPEPLLVPETPDELVGTVGNVVFPTAIELIEGKHYVFYGMADAKIGVARLERTRDGRTRLGGRSMTGQLIRPTDEVSMQPVPGHVARSAALHPSPVSPPACVAVAGAGGFGQFCLEAYRETGDISVAAVADPNLAGSPPRTHPELSITADWRNLLDVPTIEVIHLATPPLLRAEIAVPALKAGKSVFCEKPLALSLREADEILDAARLAGRSVGVDYVLRHHPAFELVGRLSASALFGSLRTFSLQNFAQVLPADHWMWDTEKSGGILVEHGVHFFDAYGQTAGAPEEVWGSAPRKDAVQVTVRYVSGAIGCYYHEFAWPQTVERTHGIMFFERGYVEIDGWIPERVHGRVDAPAAALEALVRPLCPSLEVREDSGAVSFDVRFADRQAAYRSAIVDGMRDLIAKHRGPTHRMVVSAHDARDSLSLALASRRAVETGGCERLSR